MSKVTAVIVLQTEDEIPYCVTAAEHAQCIKDILTEEMSQFVDFDKQTIEVTVQE